MDGNMTQNSAAINKPQVNKKAKRLDARLVVQIIFFVLVALISINTYLSERGMGLAFITTASTHAICPFGGVVSIYSAIAADTLVKKIHNSSMVLMYIGFGMALIAGPAFCGWACPFGSFQEWIGKLGKKVLKNSYNNWIPARLDRILRYLRYVILIWVVYVTAVSAVLVFSNFDPYFALFNFWNGEVTAISVILLFLVIGLGLLIERPFCKYACPYGAVLGIFNLFRIFGVKRNPETCINCSKCDRSCPMNIKVSKTAVVRDHQCISCLKCTSEYNCPVADTVEMKVGKMQVKNEN